MTKKKLYSENKSFDRHVGSELRKMRERTHYRQQDVADMIGKSLTTISDYENGRTTMSLGAFMDYCEAIGVDYIQAWNEIHYKRKFTNKKE